MDEKCKELSGKLSAFLDAELDGAGREAVARHLNECAACRKVFEEIQGLNRIIARVDAPEPTEAEWSAAWTNIEKAIDRGRQF